MTVSAPDEAPDAAEVRAGLEEIRLAERLRITRVLHDQIGPSLCSAGLMVGLLRSQPADLPAMANDMLETIQDALESAIDAVRTLNSSADPALAQRCGLRGALEFLARAHQTELVLRDGFPSWTGPRADAAYRILHDALLVLPTAGAACRLEGHPDRLTLASPAAPPRQPLAALSSLAAAAGLRLYFGDGLLNPQFQLSLSAEALP